MEYPTLSNEEIARMVNNPVFVNLGMPINVYNLSTYSNINYFGLNKRYPKRKVERKNKFKKSTTSEFTGPFDMTFLCSDDTPMKKKRNKRNFNKAGKFDANEKLASKPGPRGLNHICSPDDNPSRKRKLNENETPTSEPGPSRLRQITSPNYNTAKKRKFKKNRKRANALETTGSSSNSTEFTYAPDDNVRKKKLLCNIICGERKAVFDFSDVSVINDLLKGNENITDVTDLIEQNIINLHSNKPSGSHNHLNNVAMRSGSPISSSSLLENTEETTFVVYSDLLSFVLSIHFTKKMYRKIMRRSQLRSTRYFTRYLIKKKDKLCFVNQNCIKSITDIPCKVSSNWNDNNLDFNNLPMCSEKFSLKDNLLILKSRSHKVALENLNRCRIELDYASLMKSAIKIDVGNFNRNCTQEEMHIASLLPVRSGCVSFKIVSSNKIHENIGEIAERGLFDIQKMYRVRGNMRCTSNIRIIKNGNEVFIVLLDVKTGNNDLVSSTVSTSTHFPNSTTFSGFFETDRVQVLELEDIYDLEAFGKFSVLRAKSFNIDFVDLTSDKLLSYYYLTNGKKKSICEIMIRIIKNNYSFSKFRFLCTDSKKIITELEKAGIPTSMENIIGLDIVPFIRIYLKWFDDVNYRTTRFDKLASNVLKNLLRFLNTKNGIAKNSACDVINYALGTLYADRFGKPFLSFKATKKKRLMKKNRKINDAEKSTCITSTSVSQDVSQVFVEADSAKIVDNDGILSDIQINSGIPFSNSSNDIVNLVDDDNDSKNKDSCLVVPFDHAQFREIDLFEPNMSNDSDYNENKECSSVDLVDSDIFQSIHQNYTYEDITDNDAHSVNEMLDVNLDFEDLRVEEDGSLLTACEKLVSYTINDVDELDMPNTSSGVIDMPFGFDNAGTLSH